MDVLRQQNQLFKQLQYVRHLQVTQMWEVNELLELHEDPAINMTVAILFLAIGIRKAQCLIKLRRIYERGFRGNLDSKFAEICDPEEFTLVFRISVPGSAARTADNENLLAESQITEMMRPFNGIRHMKAVSISFENGVTDDRSSPSLRLFLLDLEALLISDQPVAVGGPLYEGAAAFSLSMLDVSCSGANVLLELAKTGFCKLLYSSSTIYDVQIMGARYLQNVLLSDQQQLMHGAREAAIGPIRIDKPQDRDSALAERLGEMEKYYAKLKSWIKIRRIPVYQAVKFMSDLVDHWFCRELSYVNSFKNLCFVPDTMLLCRITRFVGYLTSGQESMCRCIKQRQANRVTIVCLLYRANQNVRRSKQLPAPKARCEPMTNYVTDIFLYGQSRVCWKQIELLSSAKGGLH